MTATRKHKAPGKQQKPITVPTAEADPAAQLRDFSECIVFLLQGVRILYLNFITSNLRIKTFATPESQTEAMAGLERDYRTFMKIQMEAKEHLSNFDLLHECTKARNRLDRVDGQALELIDGYSSYHEAAYYLMASFSSLFIRPTPPPRWVFHHVLSEDQLQNHTDVLPAYWDELHRLMQEFDWPKVDAYVSKVRMEAAEAEAARRAAVGNIERTPAMKDISVGSGEVERPTVARRTLAERVVRMHGVDERAAYGFIKRCERNGDLTALGHDVFLDHGIDSIIGSYKPRSPRKIKGEFDEDLKVDD